MSKKKKKIISKAGDSGSDRRTFLANTFMGTGLVASHLFAAGLAVRYLYPTKKDNKQRLFVGTVSEIPPGSAFSYDGPGGRTVNIVRGAKGFIALSDVCPHLGCRVHWESTTEEFVCPCHDGHFDASGAPVSGPPAEMGSGLPQYDVIIDGDMVFLEMSIKA
ncbi:MAG: Rieske (2Fe-2S) protein [Proteobacteria bacterium]|nr:Rieske (2Fe-2S) protein [Pseudomonadota bacterium]